MFRVQFGGASPERALEHCRSCVQSLARYTAVQEPDGASRQLGARGSPGAGREPSAALQHGVSRLVGRRPVTGPCRLAGAANTE